jgi:ribonucleoside-diphosphate reductase alpha chain
MRNEATVDEVYNAYIEMWKQGAKGGTIYRDGCRDVQVLSKIEPSNAVAYEVSEVCPECNGVLQHQEGCSTCLDCGYSYCAV